MWPPGCGSSRTAGSSRASATAVVLCVAAVGSRVAVSLSTDESVWLFPFAWELIVEPPGTTWADLHIEQPESILIKIQQEECQRNNKCQNVIRIVFYVTNNHHMTIIVQQHALEKSNPDRNACRMASEEYMDEQMKQQARDCKKSHRFALQ